MSDRLTELQRQRALIQGHLAWLDQEIAAAKNGETPSTPTPELPESRPFESTSVAEPVIEDELIAKFGAESKSATESVRRGCFIVFAAALLLFGIGVYGLYLYSKNLHQNDAPPAPKAADDSPARGDHR